MSAQQTNQGHWQESTRRPVSSPAALVISRWHVASFCCSREYRTAGFLTASGMPYIQWAGGLRPGGVAGTRERAVPGRAQAGAGTHYGHGMGDARGLAGLSHRLVVEVMWASASARTTSTMPGRPRARDTHPPGRCVGEHWQAPEVWEKLIGTRRDPSLVKLETQI